MMKRKSGIWCPKVWRVHLQDGLLPWWEFEELEVMWPLDVEAIFSGWRQLLNLNITKKIYQVLLSCCMNRRNQFVYRIHCSRGVNSKVKKSEPIWMDNIDFTMGKAMWFTRVPIGKNWLNMWKKKYFRDLIDGLMFFSEIFSSSEWNNFG